MKDPHDIIIQPHITERSVAASYGDERGAMLRKRNAARKAAASGETAAKETKKKGAKKAATGAGAVTVEEGDLIRKYTFIVAPTANKIEIKGAIEAIYNAGKKADDHIKVTSVRTVRLPGKKKRQARVTGGYTAERKKAVVTLAQGQMLEDYGV